MTPILPCPQSDDVVATVLKIRTICTGGCPKEQRQQLLKLIGRAEAQLSSLASKVAPVPSEPKLRAVQGGRR